MYPGMRQPLSRETCERPDGRRAWSRSSRNVGSRLLRRAARWACPRRPRSSWAASSASASSTCPYSLAAYRSDQPRRDGAHHRRRARAGADVRRAVPPAPGRRRPVRLRPGRLRQRHRIHQRLVVLDHRVGRQRRDRHRLGVLRRGVREQGPCQGLVDRHRAGRPLAARRRSTSAGSRTWAPSRCGRRSSSSSRWS